jgi:hypothetical protein
MKKKKNPSSLLSDLELPYSYSLLYRHGFIPERTDALTVMRVTQRLIRIPVIAKRRYAGLPVEYILQHLSPRTMQRIRKQLSRVRQ